MPVVKRDLRNFFHHVRINEKLSETVANYYIYWTGIYLSLAQAYPQDQTLPLKQAFVLFLSAQFQKWQIDQAEDAVRLYKRFQLTQKQSGQPCKHGRKAQLTAKNYNPLAIKRWIPERDRLRTELRMRNRSYSTEKSYLYWLQRFSQFVRYKNSTALTEQNLRSFLEHLAVYKKISAATQTQAFNALLFFYRHVLKIDTPDIRSAVRSGKGDKDRETLLPEALIQPFQEQMRRVRSRFEEDRRNGIAGVPQSRPSSWAYQERIRTHPAAQLRDPSYRTWIRHQDRPGALRAFQPADHHDLYPRCSKKQAWSRKPLRPPGG